MEMGRTFQIFSMTQNQKKYENEACAIRDTRDLFETD